MPAASGKGITPKTFGGLNKSRMQTGSGSAFPRVKMKDGETVSLQFFGPINDENAFKEFDQHQWRDKNWNYVACLGKNCPLCDDEEADVAKARYRFVALVYNLGDKQVQILEGPGTLAQRISLKYEKRPKTFVKKVWDITRLDTVPTSYDVDTSDEDPIAISGKKRLDLQAYIDESASRYFGKDIPKGGAKSALDDDDYEDDDETYTKADLLDMTSKELRKVAREFKVKTDDRSKKQIIQAILRKQGE